MSVGSQLRAIASTRRVARCGCTPSISTAKIVRGLTPASAASCSRLRPRLIRRARSDVGDERGAELPEDMPLVCEPWPMVRRACHPKRKVAILTTT